MKKFAIKSLIIFFSFIIMCTFLSRTILYYLTPKVMQVSAGRGVIRQNFRFQGDILAADSSDVMLSENFKFPVFIDKIRIEPDSHVNAGDIIADISPSDQLLAAVSEAEMIYMNAVRNVESFNSRLELELINVDKEIVRKQDEVNNLTQNKDLSTADSTKNNELLAIAKRELNYLKNKKNKLLDGETDGASKNDLIRKRDNAYDSLQKLREELNSCKTLVAPGSGIVAAVYFKEEEYYDKSRPFYSIIPDGSELPVINVNIPQYASFYVREGMDCLVDYGDRQFKANVSELTNQKSPGTNIDILKAAIKPDNTFYKAFPDLITNSGHKTGVNTKANILIAYESQYYDVIIPNSCIIEKQGERYVYVLKEKSNLWGEEYYVEETPVTLGESNESVSSVSAGLKSGMKIASYWDKTLTNNGKVILLME